MRTRTHRAQIAKETLAIIAAGGYQNHTGQWIDLLPDITASQQESRIITRNSCPTPRGIQKPLTTVGNQTATQAIETLSPTPEKPAAVLNFASAHNPGGGFLNGAIAQEEDLCIASTLSAALQSQPDFYKHNTAMGSSLYLDQLIDSPNIVFFRDNEGNLRNTPLRVRVLTCPAPNKKAILENEPLSEPHIRPALLQRMRLILKTAAAHNTHTLILGAWGCGVFENTPETVAELFAEAIENHGQGIHRIHFAIPDTSPEKKFIGPFETWLS